MALYSSTRSNLVFVSLFVASLTGCGVDSGFAPKPESPAPPSPDAVGTAPQASSQNGTAQAGSSQSSDSTLYWDDNAGVWRTSTTWYDSTRKQWVPGEPPTVTAANALMSAGNGAGQSASGSSASADGSDTPSGAGSSPHPGSQSGGGSTAGNNSDSGVGIDDPGSATGNGSGSPPSGSTSSPANTFTGIVLAPSYIALGDSHLVYSASSPAFSNWSGSDRLAVGSSGEIVNLTRNQRVSVSYRGIPSDAGRIVAITMDYWGIGWNIRLDNGTSYKSDFTYNNWPGDIVLVVLSNTGASMLNLTRNQDFMVY